MLAAVGTALSGTSRCTAQTHLLVWRGLIRGPAGAEGWSGGRKGRVAAQSTAACTDRRSPSQQPWPVVLAAKWRLQVGPRPPALRPRRPRASACPASVSPAFSLSLASGIHLFCVF